MNTVTHPISGNKRPYKRQAVTPPSPASAETQALMRAIAVSGSVPEFSEQLSALRTSRGESPISRATIFAWIRRNNGASAEVCPDIEVLTGIACEQLKPSGNWSGMVARRLAAMNKLPREAAPDTSVP